MKEFSLLVRVPLTYSIEKARAVSPQWDALLERWKSENVYVISFAFPGESSVVSEPNGIVSEGPIISEHRRVVSNIVLRAASIEDAIKLAKECPVLQFDGNVEIREIPGGVPKEVR